MVVGIVFLAGVGASDTGLEWVSVVIHKSGNYNYLIVVEKIVYKMLFRVKFVFFILPFDEGKKIKSA